MMFNKGQVAMEFIWLTGIAFVFLLILTSLLSFYLQGYFDDRNKDIAQDNAFAIQKEVIVAYTARDGYYRDFIVPDKIGKIDFEANINSTFIQIKYDERYFSLRVPEVTGQFIVGENHIEKIAGEVRLN